MLSIAIFPKTGVIAGQVKHHAINKVALVAVSFNLGIFCNSEQACHHRKLQNRLFHQVAQWAVVNAEQTIYSSSYPVG
jgi:hypothetical protein